MPISCFSFSFLLSHVLILSTPNLTPFHSVKQHHTPHHHTYTPPASSSHHSRSHSHSHRPNAPGSPSYHPATQASNCRRAPRGNTHRFLAGKKSGGSRPGPKKKTCVLWCWRVDGTSPPRGGGGRDDSGGRGRWVRLVRWGCTAMPCPSSKGVDVVGDPRKAVVGCSLSARRRRRDVLFRKESCCY